jgi:two-component system, sensor histidine kinase and response regulator
VKRLFESFRSKRFYIIVILVFIDLIITESSRFFVNSSIVPAGYEKAAHPMELFVFDLSTYVSYVLFSVVILLLTPKKDLVLFLVSLANLVMWGMELMDFVFYKNEGYINLKDYVVTIAFVIVILYGVRTYRRKRGDTEEIVNVTNIALLKMFIPNKEVVTVNSLIEEKEKMNSEYNSLLYHLQHQIKQPFTSLEGLMQLEESEIRQQMIYKCIQDVKSYLRELTHLDYISNYYKLNPQSVKYRTIFNEVKSKLTNANRVHIHYYESNVDTFKMDETLLVAILDKLLQNAVNFSKETAFQKPNVNVYIYTNDPSELIIEVKDEGIGIEEASKEKIFDMFFKGSLKSSGVGLGLYIVKKTVERLKGKILVDSKVGHGTSFKVTIPQIRESQQSDSAKNSHTENAA